MERLLYRAVWFCYLPALACSALLLILEKADLRNALVSPYFRCFASLSPDLVATCARREPQDVLDNIDKLEGVERLVVAHVSERHGSHRNILRLLAAALPPTLTNKVQGQMRARVDAEGGQGGKGRRRTRFTSFVGALSPNRFLCLVAVGAEDHMEVSPTWQAFEARGGAYSTASKLWLLPTASVQKK